VDHLVAALAVERPLDVAGVDTAELFNLGHGVVDQPVRELAAVRTDAARRSRS
jgi:hypothetical protein